MAGGDDTVTSKNIDERIVQMQFDNGKFEKGVSESIKSINKLKDGLNFDSSVKSLSGLARAGQSVSFDGMASSIENIASRFTALGIVGVTALANIANSAINAGKTLISSLTIDPVSTGFNEYETKMGAIQTILTNTASKGTTLDDVNKALEALNVYSDQTIYNFAEMAKNIGTFTAAGVGLETSVTSIKGIANLAAGSGSTSEQASTAMYQLSQALAAGKVSLMDWNSVVNAGMGGELFQNALKKTAKEMGVFVDESKPFRLTLEEGWLSSDVLTKTLTQFADDPALVKAATQVKTFTQLLNTMKESVQSGWAQSWEKIIGDKEQAASFFTAINDGFGAVVGSSADARNAALAFWNANGGRTALIQGISNALIGLSSVLEPIEKGFREIFPAMTGQTLVDVSLKIRDLTSNFKIGEKTSENLKNTFKGLFALLDIGKQVLTGITGVFFSLIKFILPIGDSMLGVTGNFGEFIVAIDNALKSSTAFGTVMKTLGGIIGPIAKGIRSALIAIIDAFTTLGVVDTSGLDSFGNRIEARLDPLVKLGGIIEGIVAVFYKLASMIGNVFNKMQELIANSFGSPDFKSIFDIINGGLIAAILYNIQRFSSSLSNITGLLDGVRGCLEAYQTSLKADALLKIGIAMGILAAALVALSLIDSAKLTVALGAMAGMFIELFAAMSVFEALAGGLGFLVMMKITTGMIGMSVAILMLTGAMTKLAALNWGQVFRGLTAIAGMSATLLLTAKLMGTSSGMLIRSSIGFVIFAGAINVLAMAVERLSKLKTDELKTGFIGIGILMAELVLFMKAMNLSKMGVISSVGILVFAASLNVLALAVKKIASMDPNSLTRGLIGMAVILTEIVLFTKTIGNPAGIISTSVALTILGGAMFFISQSIAKMGNMSWSQMSIGLLAMAGSLLAITIAFNTMPNGMLLKSIALIDVAGALLMLSKALTEMGKLTWSEIARSMTTLFLSLGLIIGAFVVLQKSSLVDSAAFVVLVFAIKMLAGALKTLGSMSLTQIGTALLGLAGAFAIISVAAVVLAPIIPAILGLAAAIALLSIGVALIGGGILALSTGLAALAVSGTAASVALVTMVTGLIGLIPFALQTLAKGIVELITVIGNAAPTIVEALTKIVQAILTVIENVIPNIITVTFKLLTAIIKTLVEYIPQFVDAGMKLIIGLLKGISDNIGQVVATAIEIIVNFINGIASMIPRVIQAGFDLILSFVNGLAEALRGNTKPVTEAITNLMDALITTGVKVLTGSIDGFVNVGKNIAKGLIRGIKSMGSDIATAASNMGTATVSAAEKSLDINSPSGLFEAIGQNLGGAMSIGIDSSSKKAETSSEKMSTNVVKKASDAAKKAFNASVEWINDRKYYNELSLSEELAAWQDLQIKYSEGSEERKKADKEVYRVKKELIKSEFDYSVKWMDDRKYYNELSLNEELAAWERVQNRYIEGSEERVKADREVYRIKKELLDSAYQYSLNWIDEEKYYNKLSLNDELAAWERVQKRYLEGSEERKKADREVYRVEREISQANLDYSQKVIDVSKSANEKRIQLEEEYYDKVKSINDKLKTDIQSLMDTYDNAVASRADSLYGAYGLFDAVTEQDSVTGSDLLKNLKDQIDEFTTWQQNIFDLSNKGVSEGFINELQSMGPSSLAKIKALNSMTKVELDEYVSLWEVKHIEVKSQAIDELESLRVQTIQKISDLRTQSATELNAYRTTWNAQMSKLTDDTNNQLTQLKRDWFEKIGSLKSDTEKKISDLANNIQNVMASTNWFSVGTNMVDGMTDGIRSKENDLINTAVEVATSALQAVNDTLGIQSPSKAFGEVGKYSIQGFVGGLQKFSGDAIATTKSVGTSVIDSLKGALSKATDMISGDLDLAPTIRPVLDLTDVNAGKSALNGLFNNRTIDVSSINKKVVSISSNLSSEDTSILEKLDEIIDGLNKPTPDQNGGNISLEGLFKGAVITIREEADLGKIGQELFRKFQGESRGRGRANI